jgi:hypothetical protein
MMMAVYVTTMVVAVVKQVAAAVWLTTMEVTEAQAPVVAGAVSYRVL